MITKQALLERIYTYLSGKIDILANDNPMTGFVRPLIVKGLKRKLAKFGSFMDDFAEDDGTFDVEGTLGEMVKSVSNIKPFNLDLPVIGNVGIGGGNIRFSLPLVDKEIVFNQGDLDELIGVLTDKINVS